MIYDSSSRRAGDLVGSGGAFDFMSLAGPQRRLIDELTVNDYGFCGSRRRLAGSQDASCDIRRELDLSWSGFFAVALVDQFRTRRLLPSSCSLNPSQLACSKPSAQLS